MSQSKIIKELLITEIERLRGQNDYWKNELDRLHQVLDDRDDTIHGLRMDVDSLEWEIASYRLASGEFDAVVKRIFEENPEYYAVNKIPFIKVVREETHLGLKEAKDLVDKFFAKPLNEAEDAS